MDILNTLNQTLYPGYRVPRVKGWQGMKALFVPRDCEAIAIDEDPKVNIMYMKKVDANGVETMGWYDYTERANPEFDPDKYITKDEFNKKIEEVLDAINTNRQSASANGNTNYSRKQ